MHTIEYEQQKENDDEHKESKFSLASTESLEEEVQLQEECHELIMHFSQRLLESLLKATRQSLDNIKRRVFFST